MNKYPLEVSETAADALREKFTRQENELAALRAENAGLKRTLDEIHTELILPDGAHTAVEVIRSLCAELTELKTEAECWKQLVSAHKFNNKPAVGFAINRAIDAARSKE